MINPLRLTTILFLCLVTLVACKKADKEKIIESTIIFEKFSAQINEN